MADLAIVIPAYKMEFLDDCLSSIAGQTNKNFTLYIGDDCSPFDIAAIAEKYTAAIDLRFQRFEENLGAVSLAKHWNRCLGMIGQEKWVWLFADDDVMDACAVECFFNMRPEPNLVYRFDLNVIDNGNQVMKTIKYSREETALSFLENRLAYKYDNAIIHYIFSRAAIAEAEGFVAFPLAWCSDDASIIRFCHNGKIVAIQNCKVSWRNAGANISSDHSKHIRNEKLKARIEFVQWLYAPAQSLVRQIANHKTVVSNWFYHGMEAEAPGASALKQLRLVLPLSPFLGTSPYKVILHRAFSDTVKKIKSIVKKSIAKLPAQRN